MGKLEIRFTLEDESIKVATNGVANGSDLMTVLCVGAASVIHETAEGAGCGTKELTAYFIKALFSAVDDIETYGYDSECMDVQIQ